MIQMGDVLPVVVRAIYTMSKNMVAVMCIQYYPWHGRIMFDNHAGWQPSGIWISVAMSPPGVGGSNFSDTASVASSSFGGSTVSNFETLSVASYESEMNEDGKMMEPMTGNCLLDLYRGQKPHRRTSLTMYVLSHIVSIILFYITAYCLVMIFVYCDTFSVMFRVASCDSGNKRRWKY